LRNAFTKGTEQEVEFLGDALGLEPGQRVLDVGCGPGRHALALARRGMEVVGVDLSPDFVKLAREASAADDLPAEFEVLDVRDLAYDEEFDAAICLCQGAFGLMTAGAGDAAVIGGIARALRPGGRLALSAFNAYFAVEHHHEATFDADLGVAHERTEVRNPDGLAREVDLWTGCYTPRELRLLLATHGFEVARISSVEPGAYGDDPPTTESPEFLVIARRR